MTLCDYRLIGETIGGKGFSELGDEMRKPSSLPLKVGSAFVSMVVMPLIVLNLFSVIVGGIWLAIIGQWWTIGQGLVFGFVMPWIYAIVILPSLGLSALAVKAADRGNKPYVVILSFIVSMFNYILIAIWGFLIFSFFARSIGSNSYVPYLLWIYSTTMAPLGFMASKEPPDSTGTSIGLFFAQLNFIALTILWFLSARWYVVSVTIASLIIAFSLIIAVSAASMMSTETMIEKGNWEERNEEEGEDEKGYLK